MIKLTISFKRFGEATILNGISLSFPEGSVTALVGPSAAAKARFCARSTCSNCRHRAPSRSAPTGVDFVPGRKVSFAEIQSIRGQTGMVFQNFQLFPHRTAIENVMEGLITVQKWSREKARARAVELLEKVGMGHKNGCLAGGALGRSATARGKSPSACPFAQGAALRRTDLCARHGTWQGKWSDVLGKLAAEGTTMVMATTICGLPRRSPIRSCSSKPDRLWRRGTGGRDLRQSAARTHQAFRLIRSAQHRRV